jgi:N-acetyl-anhydromuramyl-L-alanine amidase AmpD
MSRRGSARDPGRWLLRWDSFFWHPTELSDKGEPVTRGSLENGFELLGGKEAVTVSVKEGSTEIFTVTARRKNFDLDLSTVVGREASLNVTLTPSDPMLSPERAGPGLDSKGGKFNKYYDLMFRAVSFTVELNAAGEFVTPTPGAIVAVQDPAPAPDPDPAVPSRPAPAPHAYLFATAETRGRVVRQVMTVDWKPDWVSRWHPVIRPMRVGRDGRAIREVILHITEGPIMGAAVREFLYVQKKSKQGKLRDNTKGIHYIVDIDGHVVKMLHERHGGFHAAHLTGVHAAAFGTESSRPEVAKTSIGIEHAAAAGQEWPAEQREGSLDLVRQLMDHHGLEPWNIVGHNDVIIKKSLDGLPLDTKPCPAGGLPWETFQDRGICLAADTDFDPPAAIYGGIFSAGNILDQKAPSAVIRELQDDLRRIGWWVPGKKGGKKLFGTFDESTEAGVRRFQARFMARHGLKFEKGKVDLATARRIKQVVANARLPPV